MKSYRLVKMTLNEWVITLNKNTNHLRVFENGPCGRGKCVFDNMVKGLGVQ